MAFGNNSRVTKAESSNQEQSNIQLSITAEKLNDINKSAKETVQSLNNVFSAVSGSSNFAKTFDDLTDGIQTAASALDALTKQTNNPDMALNNVASVQAQFDGLQSAYANINSKLSDLVKSTDTSAINDVDKVIHNIEKMEQSTSDVSKSLKKSLQKMAEESGNTAEIDSTLRTLENNFASVSDEIKSKFNELIELNGQGLFETTQDLLKKHDIGNNIDDVDDADFEIYERLLDIYHEYDNEFREDILELIDSHPKFAKFATV